VINDKEKYSVKEIYDNVPRKILNRWKQNEGLPTDNTSLQTLDSIIEDMEQQRKEDLEQGVNLEYQNTWDLYDLYEIREYISSMFNVSN
jgi:hypothetical protein